ncbi:MAG: hypothetical protein SGJ02_05805, partial [bacterium]|nr:hypothetical protein [bacterium]
MVSTLVEKNPENTNSVDQEATPAGSHRLQTDTNPTYNPNTDPQNIGALASQIIPSKSSYRQSQLVEQKRDEELRKQDIIEQERIAEEKKKELEEEVEEKRGSSTQPEIQLTIENQLREIELHLTRIEKRRVEGKEPEKSETNQLADSISEAFTTVEEKKGILPIEILKRFADFSQKLLSDPGADREVKLSSADNAIAIIDDVLKTHKSELSIAESRELTLRTCELRILKAENADILGRTSDEREAFNERSIGACKILSEFVAQNPNDIRAQSLYLRAITEDHRIEDSHFKEYAWQEVKTIKAERGDQSSEYKIYKEEAEARIIEKLALRLSNIEGTNPDTIQSKALGLMVLAEISQKRGEHNQALALSETATNLSQNGDIQLRAIRFFSDSAELERAQQLLAKLPEDSLQYKSALTMVSGAEARFDPVMKAYAERTEKLINNLNDARTDVINHVMLRHTGYGFDFAIDGKNTLSIKEENNISDVVAAVFEIPKDNIHASHLKLLAEANPDLRDLILEGKGQIKAGTELSLVGTPLGTKVERLVVEKQILELERSLDPKVITRGEPPLSAEKQAEVQNKLSDLNERLEHLKQTEVVADLLSVVVGAETGSNLKNSEIIPRLQTLETSESNIRFLLDSADPRSKQFAGELLGELKISEGRIFADHAVQAFRENNIPEFSRDLDRSIATLSKAARDSNIGAVQHYEIMQTITTLRQYKSRAIRDSSLPEDMTISSIFASRIENPASIIKLLNDPQSDKLEAEKAYRDSIRSAAIDLQLIASENSKKIDSEFVEQHVRALERNFVSLGVTPEKIKEDLEREISATSALFNSLSNDTKLVIQQRLDEASRRLKNNPNFPSENALIDEYLRLKDELSKSIKESDRESFAKLFNNSDLFTTYLYQVTTLNNEAATKEDIELIQGLTDADQLRTSVDKIASVIDTKSNKDVEKLLTDIRATADFSSWEQAKFGILEKNLTKIQAGVSEQTFAQLRYLLARSELRLQALDAGSYLDLHRPAKAEESIKGNFSRLGLDPSDVTAATRSYVKGANLITAQHNLALIVTEANKFGDHHYNKDTKKFEVGAGGKGVVTHAGKADEFIQDATIACRHLGVSGNDLAATVAGFMDVVQLKFANPVSEDLNKSLAAIEELRKSGLTQVELSGNNLFKSVTLPTLDPVSTYKDFISKYSALGLRDLSEEDLLQIEATEVNEGRGTASIVILHAEATKKWLDYNKAYNLDFSPETATQEQLADLCKRIYDAEGGNSNSSMDFHDLKSVKKLNDIAELQSVAVILQSREQNVPYLNDALAYYSGNLPQDQSLRMLIEARALESQRFCQRFIVNESEKKQDREYDRAGGWLGITATTVTKNMDAFYRGVSADWISPERIGRGINKIVFGDKHDAIYDDYYKGFNNLDGITGTLAHGSVRVSNIGGMAVGAFLGSEFLQGGRIAGLSLRMGQMNSVALAMAGQQAFRADDKMFHLLDEKGNFDYHFNAAEIKIGDRAYEGGKAYLQGLLFAGGTHLATKGIGFLGKAGSSALPEAATALTQKATLALKEATVGTSIVSRMTSGAVINVASDAAVAAVTGHGGELTLERIIDSAIFGAVFEGLGAHKAATLKSKAEAKAKLEQVAAKDPIVAEKIIEIYNLKKQLAEMKVQDNPSSFECYKNEIIISQKKAALETMLNPDGVAGIGSRIVDSFEATRRGVGEVAKATQRGLESVSSKIDKVENFLLVDSVSITKNG